MKEFKNITKNQKEKAIKIGHSVPSDAANIALFDQDEVLASNSLFVIDVSDNIPENKIEDSFDTKIMYANEFGVLEDEKGNVRIPTDQISISDNMLSKEYSKYKVDPSTTNENDFMHYYYVSRYFILAQRGYRINSIYDVPKSDYYSLLNIKVLDENNNEYIDFNTGRKKYKILIEPYLTTLNELNPEVPHKIFVGLDSSEPKNLKLVYDKIEVSSTGETSGLHLNYTETINAVPFFEEVAEEALVVDPNNIQQNKYSVKNYLKKYAEINKQSGMDTSGFQAFVPKKALADNRTFEVFNWRLIARAKQSVNLDIIADSRLTEDSTNTKIKTVNVAVLYDSQDTTSNAAINPYVFYRLEKSPFNFSKFEFVNPLVKPSQNNITKEMASYWKVDIQSVNDLGMFDVLAFAPTRKLSEKAITLIDKFVNYYNGTLIVDGGLYPSSAPFYRHNITLSNLDTANATSFVYNTSSKILDEDKNGGWNIDNTIFEKPTYGIFGLKSQKYRYINSVDSPLRVLSINNNCAAALYEFPSKGDSLSQGNIILTSFQFLRYCNAVYNAAGDGTVLDSSTGETAYVSSSTGALSGVVEGPYKFLFNSVALALFYKGQASRKIDTRSILYNYVGEWNSSWTMYTDAVEEDEKVEFTNISADSTKIKLGKDLIKSFDSIGAYYKSILINSMPDIHKQKISQMNMSNFTFYIEVTNPDVELTNCTSVSTANLAAENMPSSYYVKKISDPLSKCYAYTDKFSAPITIPENFGPYVVRQAPSIKSSDTKILNNSINPISQFKSYPFNLSTNYSYITATDKPVSFNGTYTLNVDLHYFGTAKEPELKTRWGSVIRKWKTEESYNENFWEKISNAFTITGATVDQIPCLELKSAMDKNLLSQFDSDKSYNNFIYTGDINLGNSTNSWSTAYANQFHEYVMFLQLAMKATGRYGAGNYTNWPVDGKYGPKTAKAIESFQQTQKNLGNCYYVDGIVDSETKSLIARRLKTMENEDFAHYARWRMAAALTSSTVLAYWDASVNSTLIQDMGIRNGYKKISFTGFEGPGSISDVIYFKLPEGYDTIKSVSVDFGRWRNARIVRYGYSPVDWSNFGLTRDQRLAFYTSSNLVDISPNIGISAEEVDAGIATINLDVPYANCKYMYVVINSNEKLNKINPIFGKYAEGFAIERIFASAKYADTNIPAAYGWVTRTLTRTINNTSDYEAVDSLTSAPDTSYTKEYNGRTMNQYASDDLYFDGTLKAKTVNKKVYVRGTEDGYYNWNGSSWIKEDKSGDYNIRVEDYTIEKTNIVPIKISAVITEPIANLNPTTVIHNFYSVDTCRSKNIYFTNIIYRYKDIDYNQSLTGTGYNFNSGSITTAAGVTIDLNACRAALIPSNASATITSLTSDTGQTISSPNTAGIVSVEYLGRTGDVGPFEYTQIRLTTSATYYSGSNVYTTPIKNISKPNYSLTTLDKKVLDDRESVTVHDGILLLADRATSAPIGIPSATEVTSSLPALSTGEERDMRFGNVNLYNNGSSNEVPGMIYGFYDISQNEFLGRSIPYTELYNRGIDKVYIAVCAIDADGNTQNAIDYIGPKVSTTFKPVNIPLKKIYPVYSVKFNSNSRIRIGNMGLDLEKTQAWPLAITRGSFIKKINLSSNIYEGWESGYLNLDLTCYYDTSNIPDISWSKIFGRGYYEVIDENPVIVSETSIKLRQSPFVVWGEPSTYDPSDFKLIRPQFEVYKNTNLAATKASERVWEKIPLSQVKNYNSNTGVIEFKSRIVPNKSKDIKVSYISKNSDAHVYQVGGNEVPLNPLLNQSSIQSNKPLYVYILPTKIEKRSNILSQFSSNEVTTEYTNTYPVNFTYDKNIFDKTNNSYNPFALMIGMVFYSRNNNPTQVYDTRLRGGGVSSKYDIKEALEYTKDALSYWDMYPAHGMAYPKGGYVIIKLPQKVKENFIDVSEIYDVVYRNMTAGVSFEIQDMNGNPFGVM